MSNRIEECRKQRGWSRAKLAQRVGVTERTVYRWERGEVSVPADRLLRLADELAVRVEELGCQP